ncbi:hypothetical protein NC99_26570 [Sunxiuqinia dokdonensis]|uniref:Uncharacterized protein n=1 Tax=Sunxiuqinia dokdonensis TaxID=1409788 RepID=A0A0L8V891_9BACT|nr:hypothetical protein NC99_26570 [Sunxiuqinia dokdonensis]
MHNFVKLIIFRGPSRAESLIIFNWQKVLTFSDRMLIFIDNNSPNLKKGKKAKP